MNARRDAGGPGPGHWLAIAACVVAVATVAAAIMVMGSPSAQREAKLDSRRVHDLNRIVQLVELHVERYDALPPDLAALADQPGRRLSIADPQSGAPYAYEVTGERTFRLCAVFATDAARTPVGAGPWDADEWSHGAGRQCFERTAGKKESRDT